MFLPWPPEMEHTIRARDFANSLTYAMDAVRAQMVRQRDDNWADELPERLRRIRR